MWKTMTGLGKLQRRYLDPVSGQAGYFGIVEEGGTSAIVTVRVKVEGRRITEAEWLIARKGDPGLNGPAQPGQPAGNFFDPDNLSANPPPDKPLAKEARSSREAMVAATNSYFDGITTHDGAIIMAYPGCTRVENGATVTGRAGGQGARGGAAAPARGGSTAVTDCTSNLEGINVQLVAARRYCDVTGIDYVPALIERAQVRASAEGTWIDFQVGDAQALLDEDWPRQRQ